MAKRKKDDEAKRHFLLAMGLAFMAIMSSWLMINDYNNSPSALQAAAAMFTSSQ